MLKKLEYTKLAIFLDQYGTGQAYQKVRKELAISAKKGRTGTYFAKFCHWA